MATKANRESPTSDAAKLRRAETSRLRVKIDSLVDRLQDHALGKKDMTATQIAAAQTLLKKVMPDLISAKAELNVSPVVFNISTTAAKK